MQDSHQKVRAPKDSDAQQANTVGTVLSPHRKSPGPWSFSYEVNWNNVIGIFHSQMAGQIGEAFLLFRS